MSILKLVATRILLSLLTLLLVSLIIFFVLEILPGDVASRILGRDATPETLNTLRVKLGLYDPAVVRYWHWLSHFVTGDFGHSLVSSRPVTDILAPRIFNTVVLSAYAFLLYLPLTVLPAIIQAIRRDKLSDPCALCGDPGPAVDAGFPAGDHPAVPVRGGVRLFPAISLVDHSSTAFDYLRATTLPALTLAIVMAVYAVRMLRDNLIEVLDSDYIRMAELKGLSAKRVLLRHALPNALVPTLNVTALNLAYLVGGVVVVEKVFSYPGFGSQLVDSLQLRDLPVIEAVVMIAAVVYVGANLLADIAALLLNPRIGRREMAVTMDKAPRVSGRWRSLWRQTPQSFRIGLIILVLHLIVAVTGPFWAPYGFSQMGAGIPLSGMTWKHPFGIDQLGRDVFTRVVHGAHIVILLSLSGTALGLVVGAILGLLSGYVGGWFDNALQRVLEALISIPFLVLALIAIASAGPQLSGNPILVVLVVALVYAPRIARMARAAAIDIATRDYVTMARLRGESAWSVMRRELIPNATSVLLVEFALRAGYAPVLIGSLGFLGFGLRPPTPEWGLMISENRALIIITPITVLGRAWL